jgi:hypothetical protein
MKCKYRKCFNEVVGIKPKRYCSLNCKNSEKYYKRRDKEILIEKYKIIENQNFTKGDFLNNRIIINISYRNITHYLKLGYDAMLNSNLEINVLDLPSVSHVRVDAICEKCFSINNIQFCKYVSNKERDGSYTCKMCKVSKTKKLFNIERSEDRHQNIDNISFRLYKNEVRRLTKRNSKLLFDNWNGCDYYDDEYIKDNLSSTHTSDGYPTIDHKTSVYHGFKNNILASEIADINNLCITKRSINSSKRNLLDYEFPKS